MSDTKAEIGGIIEEFRSIVDTTNMAAIFPAWNGGSVKISDTGELHR